MIPTNHYYLTQLKMLAVTGEKTAAFLHGQFTNAIKDMQAGCGNYNLLLTSKGKIRADADVVNCGAYFAFIATPAALSIIHEHLAKLAPLSKCMLSPVASSSIWHVTGPLPGTEGIWLGGEIRSIGIGNATVQIYRSDRLGCEGYDVIADNLAPEKFRRWSGDNGLMELTERQVELMRLKNGVPRWGVDFDETCLPQEALLDRALNFEKGCYLGQEIIARLKYRGHVNRVLSPFSRAGKIPENERTVVDADGREVGRITGSAHDPESDMTYLLAFVPAQAVENRSAVFVAGKELKVPLRWAA